MTRTLTRKVVFLLAKSDHTAFYRAVKGGNIKRKVFTEKITCSEIAEEMRANGLTVIKVYAGNISSDQFDRWELLNRKK